MSSCHCRRLHGLVKYVHNLRLIGANSLASGGNCIIICCKITENLSTGISWQLIYLTVLVRFNNVFYMPAHSVNFLVSLSFLLSNSVTNCWRDRVTSRLVSNTYPMTVLQLLLNCAKAKTRTIVRHICIVPCSVRSALRLLHYHRTPSSLHPITNSFTCA